MPEPGIQDTLPSAARNSPSASRRLNSPAIRRIFDAQPPGFTCPGTVSDALSAWILRQADAQDAPVELRRKLQIHPLGKLAGSGKAQPRAAGAPGAVTPVEALEEPVRID